MNGSLPRLFRPSRSRTPSPPRVLVLHPYTHDTRALPRKSHSTPRFFPSARWKRWRRRRRFLILAFPSRRFHAYARRETGDSTRDCDEIHPHDRSSFLKSLSLKPHVKKVKKNNAYTLTYANARKEKRILQNYGMFNPISLFLVIQFNQPASYNLLSVIRFPRGEFPPLGTGSSALVA